MPTRTITRSAGTRAAIRTRSSTPRLYLSANPDVKAAGIDPLVALRPVRLEGGPRPLARLRSRAVSRRQSGRAAADVDPLAHFLQFGAQEGRQPFAPTALIAANGFDYVYYLQPQSGRRGRRRRSVRGISRPSAGRKGAIRTRCSTPTGYLAAYADVAAAGINPLDHYHQFGWREGRDPSVDFDTDVYLAHHPDVAAAARRSAAPLPAARHPRGPLGLRRRHVGLIISGGRATAPARLVSSRPFARLPAASADPPFGTSRSGRCPSQVSRCRNW